MEIGGISTEIIDFVFALVSIILFGGMGFFFGSRKGGVERSAHCVEDMKTSNPRRLSSVKKQNYILLAFVALLMFTPLMMNSLADFEGADDQSTKLVTQANSEFQPWFNPFFEPSNELEPWLFALQAGFGAAIFGYIIGCLRGITEDGPVKV